MRVVDITGKRFGRLVDNAVNPIEKPEKLEGASEMKIETEIDNDTLRRLQNVMSISAQRLSLEEAFFVMAQWGLVAYERNQIEFEGLKNALIHWPGENR